MFESNIRLGRFHADCGSSSEEIVDTVEKHYGLFYIRANRCATPYDDIVALRGWKIGEVGGASVKLNSILTKKWKGMAYRLSSKGKGGWTALPTCERVNTRTTAY